MARNSEKAMTALARWLAAKKVAEGEDRRDERRPYLATECGDIKECERWRLQIIREISKAVSSIQNAGLGEFRIRDLNDEINKKLREKGHWEARIVELGGKDLRKRSRMLDREGKEVPGNRGYKYFGAARELPGVRELFDAEPPPPPKKTRAELMKDIDARYYGFRDDDDGQLVPLEVAAEKEAVASAVNEWKTNKNQGLSTATEGDAGGVDVGAEEEEDLYMLPPEMSEADRLEEAMKDGKEARYFAHVPIPTQKDIEAALLRRKKQELLQMYALEDKEKENDEEEDEEKENDEEAGK